MSSSTAAPVSVTGDVSETSQILLRLNDDVAAPSAVAAIRPAARHMSLTAETHAAVSAITCLATNHNPIDKHYTSNLTADNRANAEPPA